MILCFYGQLIALPRSMLESNVIIFQYSAIQVHFRFARAGQLLSFSFYFEGMLNRGYRVRAARRRG